jgi:hypothetical protein
MFPKASHAIAPGVARRFPFQCIPTLKGERGALSQAIMLFFRMDSKFTA